MDIAIANAGSGRPSHAFVSSAADVVAGVVSREKKVPKALIFNRSRCRAETARARQLAMYLAHVVLGQSLTSIGIAFGRDRTTVRVIYLTYQSDKASDSADRPALPRLRPSLSGLVAEGGGFDGLDDFADFLRECSKYLDRRFASKHGGLVYDYASGNGYLHIEVLDDTGGHVGKLFAAAVPFWLDVVNVQPTDVAVPERHSVGGKDHGRKGPVYLLVSDLVETVEGPVPSLIWFEPEKHLSEREWGGGAFPSSVLRRFALCFPEREFGVFGRTMAGDSANPIIYGMVEGGPQTPYDIEPNDAEIDWELRVHARLKQGLACAPIFLSEEGIWFAFVEGSFDGLKLGDVSLRPVN